MKKIILSLLILPVFLTASEPDYTPLQIDSTNTINARLCRFWTRDFDTNAYVCDFLTGYYNIVEANEMNTILRQIYDRLDSLEARVSELEATK